MPAGRSPPIRRQQKPPRPTALGWRGRTRCRSCSTSSPDGETGRMPELPEVETIRARLAPRPEGRSLERVEIVDPRLTRPEPPEAIAAELEGERITAVGRRGKYLV